MSQQPQPIFQVDPFVAQALQGLLGKRLVVETPRGSLGGVLKDAKPDHIVLQEADGKVFFVRTAQIIWVMPT
jgi:hypothetical protein